MRPAAKAARFLTLASLSANNAVRLSSQRLSSSARMICIKTFVEIVDVAARGRGLCALIAESEATRKAITQNVLRDVFNKFSRCSAQMQARMPAFRTQRCVRSARRRALLLTCDRDRRFLGNFFNLLYRINLRWWRRGGIQKILFTLRHLFSRGLLLNHLTASFEDRALFNHECRSLNVSIHLRSASQLNSLTGYDVSINDPLNHGDGNFDVGVDLTTGPHNQRSRVGSDAAREMTIKIG